MGALNKASCGLPIRNAANINLLLNRHHPGTGHILLCPSSHFAIVRRLRRPLAYSTGSRHLNWSGHAQATNHHL